jgi:hypothetical protein
MTVAAAAARAAERHPREASPCSAQVKPAHLCTGDWRCAEATAQAYWPKQRCRSWPVVPQQRQPQWGHVLQQLDVQQEAGACGCTDSAACWIMCSLADLP